MNMVRNKKLTRASRMNESECGVARNILKHPNERRIGKANVR
jgi:hypothetical protein